MPVYMIRAGEDDPVRITFSREIGKVVLRREQTHHYEQLYLIREIPGEAPMRRALCAHFDDYRIRGEWFRWCPEMLDFTPEKVSRLSAKQQKVVERLLSGGLTMKDLAAELKLSRERIRQIALLEGHTGKSLGEPRRAETAKRKSAAQLDADRRRAEKQAGKERLVADVIALRKRGMDQHRIGIELGISQVKVSGLLIANGMRSRKSHVSDIKGGKVIRGRRVIRDAPDPTPPASVS
jgi:hypothetical protein